MRFSRATVRKRLAEIRHRGGRIVVVDPRRTETARAADRHLFIRPGTDVFLLAALIHVVFAEGLAAPGPLADHVDGLDRLRELTADFAPERVAARTGIDAGAIRALAREFCAADAAVAYGRMGVSTQDHGALCQWLVYALNIATGNFDRPGGAMFTTPAVDLCDLMGPGSFDRHIERAKAAGAHVQIYESERLQLDIDLPEDLDVYAQWQNGANKNGAVRLRDEIR